jgi:hypothetical protein
VVKIKAVLIQYLVLLLLLVAAVAASDRVLLAALVAVLKVTAVVKRVALETLLLLALRKEITGVTVRMLSVVVAAVLVALVMAAVLVMAASVQLVQLLGHPLLMRVAAADTGLVPSHRLPAVPMAGLER